MSEQNVRIVRRLYEMFAARDNAGPFEIYAPDIEWDARDSGLLGVGNLYVGHDGVRRFWRDWLAAWTSVSTHDFSLEAVGEDRVLATWRQTLVGHHSGLTVDATPAMVWTLRDGKVIRMQLFHDHARARQVSRGG